jgi:cytochrome c oxidase subunit III
MNATVASGSRLPAYVSGSRAPGWWGILLLVVIEATVFSTLIATYFYLFAGSATVWPPDGVSPPDLTLPGINFFILMACAGPILWADRAIRRDDQWGLRLGYVAVLVLATVFLVLKYVEYSGLDYRWDTNAYSSIVWTITGFHSVHVAAVMLKTIAILALAWTGFFGSRRHVAIQGNTLYWLFVIGAWIPLFATLYLFPHANFG